MRAAGQDRVYDPRTGTFETGRLMARLTALVMIGLIAASGGLLSEMNRMAQPADPAMLTAQG